MLPDRKSVSVKRAGKALVFTLIGALTLAVGGFAAYKVFFNRSGEAAIRFIPGDADVVLTLDTNPSERQALTFKNISSALDEQGISQKLEDLAKSAMDDSPVASEIRPYLSTNFAMAYWKTQPGQPEKMAVLMAVKDSGAVQKALEKLPKKGETYTLPQTSGSAQMIENYLVIAPSSEALGAIKAIQAKGSGSIADNAAFTEARAALPSDANLMVFVSPKLLQDLGKEAASMGAKMNPFTTTSWLSFSVTVEPEGIAFDYYGPTNASAFPGLKNLASVASVSADSLRMLPDGALGVLVYSQIGKYWDYAKEVTADQPEAKDTMQKGVAEFEKETGLSVDKDIVPAFNGETIVAFYPTGNTKEFDGDCVTIFTDKNGATPAELVRKVRTLVEKKSKEGGNQGVTFVENQVGDATVWEFDEATQAEFLKGMKSGGSDVPKQLESKSFFVAIKGQNVILASGKATLNRVLNNTGKTLLEDPSFAVLGPELEKGTQGLLAVNLHGLLINLRPMIEPSMKESPVTMDELISMFGDGAMPMYAVGKYDGKTGTARMMIPLDYQVVIKMIGQSMKSMDQHQRMDGGAASGLHDDPTPILK